MNRKSWIIIVIVAIVIMAGTSFLFTKVKFPTSRIAAEITGAREKKYESYQFNKYNEEVIVIRESSITLQEDCKNPKRSSYIPKDAELVAAEINCMYYEDNENYYVADMENELITVATKEKPGAPVVHDSLTFNGNGWSVIYSPQEFYVHTEGDSCIFAYQGDAAGSNIIMFTESEYTNAKEALENKRSYYTCVSEIKETEVNGYKAYICKTEYNHSAGPELMSTFYSVENDGKVIIIEIAITIDSREEQAKEQSDIINAVMDSLKIN